MKQTFQIKGKSFKEVMDWFTSCVNTGLTKVTNSVRVGINNIKMNSVVKSLRYAFCATIYNTLVGVLPVIRFANSMLALAMLVTCVPSLNPIQEQIAPVFAMSLATYFVMMLFPQFRRKKK